MRNVEFKFNYLTLPLGSFTIGEKPETLIQKHPFNLLAVWEKHLRYFETSFVSLLSCGLI